MSETEPKVGCSIDLTAEGKHFGYLNVPHSHDRSAWGAVRLPIVSIRGGAGPTAVLTGGNHGDEYEGPITLLKLARALEPSDIAGQVIVIPALNYPAVMNGSRVSPIDGVNMNRAFPGRRDGTVSEMIAHFVQHRIVPACDALLDIHSGGKTLMFTPFACYHRLPDKALTQRARAAAEAFGAAVSLELVELDAGGMLDTAVEEMGKLFVSTELGGGGTTTTDTLDIAQTGVRNWLAHLEIIDEAPVSRAERDLAPTRAMHMPEPGCTLIADDAGLYEALVDLDTEVHEGEPLGRVHFPERPEREPVLYRAGTSGVLIGRSHKVLVEPGDFLALVAHPL